jgi:hypothetical protein
MSVRCTCTRPWPCARAPSPTPWPPAELAGEEPLALLDRAYAGMRAEFAARKPADPAGSWYTPDQTLGLWIRRMTQETVIDRIGELLKVFVAYSVEQWGDYFTEILAGSPGRT